MVALPETQAANIRAALAVAQSLDQAERLAFGIWSESGGKIYANDGTNKSNSPGFGDHPEWPGILRRSLSIPHDAIGNNGRSTGMLQQISADVGGGWGDMAGTMDPATSARRFLDALVITDNANYTGTLQKPGGGSERVTRQLSSPIAADVLRVQQPLMNEALSSNYDAAQVAIAKEIAAQLWRPTTEVGPSYVDQLLGRK